MGSNRTGELIKAAVFPLLAVVVAVSGWAGIRPEPIVGMSEWLPPEASVSWVSMDDQTFSLQQGPVADHGTTVPPDIVSTVDPQAMLWRVEVNPVDDAAQSDGRVVALTFAIDDAIRLAGIDMTFGYIALNPQIPVISGELLAGADHASEVDVTLRDTGWVDRTVPVRVGVDADAQRTGCAQSLLTLDFDSTTFDLTGTWCRERGLIDFTFRQGGSGSSAEATEAAAVEAPAAGGYRPSWPAAPALGETGRVETTALNGTTGLWLGEPSAVVTRADGVVLQAIEESVVAQRIIEADEYGVQTEVLWRLGGAGPIVALAGSDNLTFAADAAGFLLGATASGGIIWRVRLPDTAGVLVADQGLVFAHSVDGTLTAIDALTGQVRWRTQVGPRTNEQPLGVAAGVVAVAGFDSVRAFDPATGRELFSWDGLVPWATAVADGRVYVGESGLGIIAADADGRLLWRRVNDVAVTALLASSSGVVVVGSRGTVAYDAAGQELWHRSGLFTSALAAADGAVVLVGRDGIELVDAAGTTLGSWQGVTSAVAVSDAGIIGSQVRR